MCMHLMQATCSTHRILLDLIFPIMPGDMCRVLKILMKVCPASRHILPVRSKYLRVGNIVIFDVIKGEGRTDIRRVVMVLVKGSYYFYIP